MRIGPLLRAGVVATAAAGGALGYAAGYEVRAFRLRRVSVPVLPRGCRPLRVLQLTDLHLLPGQRRKQQWVRSLAALKPDLVVDTGDNLAHLDAVPALLDAFGPLLDLPGAFVFGSNDYWGPVPKNPLRYFNPSPPKRLGAPLPWRSLRDELRAAGWLDLNNGSGTLTLSGARVALVGVDDPHIDRDRYEPLDPSARQEADVTLGVMHAPYRRVLDAMSADGLSVLLAGHTHGGQLCVPGFGALVTNCDLPRRQAKGLSRWHGSWLHVSAGLGTSPYTPVRFACPPEATLLTLTPRRDDAVR